MSVRHIHANYIIGWANGRVVEEWDIEEGIWREVYSKAPFWDPLKKYRFRPEMIKKHGYIAIVDRVWDTKERISWGIYKTDDEALTEHPDATVVLRVEWEEEI